MKKYDLRTLFTIRLDYFSAVLVYSPLGHTQHPTHISVTQFEREKVLWFFKPFKQQQQQQQHVTAPLYVSQFMPFLLFFCVKNFSFVSFACSSNNNALKRRRKENPVAFQMIANLLWKCDDKIFLASLFAF